jgi:hypothetical protein
VRQLQLRIEEKNFELSQGGSAPALEVLAWPISTTTQLARRQANPEGGAPVESRARGAGADGAVWALGVGRPHPPQIGVSGCAPC